MTVHTTTDTMAPLSLLVLVFTFVCVVASQGPKDCSVPPQGWPREPPNCCDQPHPTDEMRKNLVNCIRQYESPTSAVVTEKSIRERKICVEECVYRSSGFITKEDNVIQRDELKKKMSSSAGESWENAIKSSLDTCFAEAEAIEDSESSAEEEVSCSPLPERLTFCLTRQLFLNCPENVWKDSQECQIVKNRMEECPLLLPPPPQRFVRNSPFLRPPQFGQ